MTVCPEPGQIVEAAVDRLATQYRESPKLIHLIRTYVGQIEEAALAACAVPDFFDIETAVGDQLTMLGRRMGWPRCHCVCETQPAFGFGCDGYAGEVPVVGFCDENVTWIDCGVSGFAEICLVDDEMYRRTLLARRYQMQALYDFESLTAAIRHIYGPTAVILDSGVGRVVIAPGRDLTQAETAVLQVVPRVLPVAPGIRVRYHFGALRVFGFGAGWGGLCDIGAPLVTEDEDEITVSGESTGDPDIPLVVSQSTEWMCEIDPRPYDC